MKSEMEFKGFGNESEHNITGTDTSSDIDCYNYTPSFKNYILDLDGYLIAIITISTFITLCILGIYLTAVRSILNNTPQKFVTKTIILCGIYPIITIFSTIAIWVPKAFLITDTVSTLSFMYCAYIFYSLCLDYVSGETNFIKIADQNAFTIRTPPCFCCFFCIKRSPITKTKFTVIRWMIFQLSIVQTIIFVTLNIVYIEEKRIYEQFFLYLAPFMVTSIGIGVWGLNIAVRMMVPYFTEFKLMPKYIVLQAVLILCKFQPAVIEWLSGYIYFPCNLPNTPQIYRKSLVQLLIIGQMCILFAGALYLYRFPKKR